MKRIGLWVILFLSFIFISGCGGSDGCSNPTIAPSAPGAPSNPPPGYGKGSIVGIVTLNGRPLSGVSVSIQGPKAPKSSPVLTGTDGRFSFENLEFGTYTVTVSKAGYDSMNTVCILSDIEYRIELSFSFSGSGIITGVVNYSTGESGVPEVPLEGALVTLTGPETFTVYTNAEGHFSFTGLELGDYLITVSKPGYDNKIVNCTLSESDKEKNITLSLSGSATITGSVNFLGAPVESADVKLDGPSSNTFITGPDGTFLFPDLEFGTYTITISKPGYKDIVRTFTLSGSNYDENLGNLSFVRDIRHCFGGRYQDQFTSVAVHPDGTIWMAGVTSSVDGDLPDNLKGKYDAWILVVDPTKPEGEQVKYSQRYGGSEDDQLNSIAIAPDGKVWAAGYSDSNNGDLSEHFGAIGRRDGWVVCLEPKPNGPQLVHSKNFGGTAKDEFFAIAISGGKIWASGYTESNNENLQGNKGKQDGWLVCLEPESNNLNLVYSKNFGGNQEDIFNAIAIAPNGNVWTAGFSKSPAESGGDVPTQRGNEDGWLLCIKPDQNDLNNSTRVYAETFGGEKKDLLTSIAIAPGDKLWVAGTTSSDTGDLLNKHFGQTTTSDGWLLCIDQTKLTEDRGLIHSLNFGGTRRDEFFGVAVAPDGKIWFSGEAKSSNNDLTSNIGETGESDVWVVCINPAKITDTDRGIEQSSNFGGKKKDRGMAISIGSDGIVWVSGLTVFPTEDPDSYYDFLNYHGGESDGFLMNIYEP